MEVGSWQLTRGSELSCLRVRPVLAIRQRPTTKGQPPRANDQGPTTKGRHPVHDQRGYRVRRRALQRIQAGRSRSTEGHPHGQRHGRRHPAQTQSLTTADWRLPIEGLPTADSIPESAIGESIAELAVGRGHQMPGRDSIESAVDALLAQEGKLSLDDPVARWFGHAVVRRSSGRFHRRGDPDQVAMTAHARARRG